MKIICACYTKHYNDDDGDGDGKRLRADATTIEYAIISQRCGYIKLN